MNRTFFTQVAGRIKSFLGKFTGQREIFLVDVLVRGDRKNLVLEVFIDGDTGIDAGTCAEISSVLGKDLDGSVLAGETYTLTVSSPGLDRPLKFPRQYPKHVGREILVMHRSGASTERLRGVLVAAGDRSIQVQPEPRGTAREIAFDDIVEAKIEPRW